MYALSWDGKKISLYGLEERRSSPPEVRTPFFWPLPGARDRRPVCQALAAVAAVVLPLPGGNPDLGQKARTERLVIGQDLGDRLIVDAVWHRANLPAAIDQVVENHAALRIPVLKIDEAVRQHDFVLPLFWPYSIWIRNHLYRTHALKAATQQLAYIQKCAAKNGIVAIWLNNLVTELKKRSPQVTISSPSISQGNPEFFVWNKSSMRFLVDSAGYAKTGEPKLTLLGPSHQLIAKHQTLLPIGSYMALLGFVAVKPITPSNQLSCVLLFESSGQQILVTGDSGCVDFPDPVSKSYFQTMLDAVGDPHVLQVAHHAGSNADF